MFDVGFFELIVIFVIGLLVLGPERLPRVAARVGNWVGQARRMTRNLKYQLEDELALQERKAAAEKFIADIDKDIRGEPPPVAPADVAPDSADAQAPGTSDTGKAS